MDESLLARRKQAENSFNSIQTSINSVKAELGKWGVDTLEEAYNELWRFQGEYRALNDLLNKPKADPAAVSPTADTVDVEAATKGDKK